LLSIGFRRLTDLTSWSIRTILGDWIFFGIFFEIGGETEIIIINFGNRRTQVYFSWESSLRWKAPRPRQRPSFGGSRCLILSIRGRESRVNSFQDAKSGK
jgi:hypothetical protein